VVPVKKLGDLLERFSLPLTFPHQRFLLLAVIIPASLFHLQHSHCLRSLKCVASEVAAQIRTVG
jgi:hypothetical protein